MGDFTATRPNVYTAGAVIFAANHNLNETTLYTAHNNAINATTGHGHTGATGDGPLISITAGTSGTLSVARGGTGTTTATGTAGSVVLSISPTFATSTEIVNTTDGATQTLENIRWRSPTPANSDELILNLSQSSSTTADAIQVQIGMLATDATHATRSSALTFKTMTSGTLAERLRVGPTGDVGIISGQKLLLDGVSLAGNTYFIESSADVVDLFVGGTSRVNVSTTAITFNNLVDVIIGATAEFHYDGSATGDTYTIESSANVLDTYVGATRLLRGTANKLSINSGAEAGTGTTILDVTWNSASPGTNDELATIFYLNSNTTGSAIEGRITVGIGDVTHASRASYMFFTVMSAGGTLAAPFQVNPAGVALPALGRLYFDGLTGTGNTYMFESSNDNIRVVASGATSCEFNLEGILLPATDPPTAGYTNRNSGSQGRAEVSATGAEISSYNVSSTARTADPGQYLVTWDTDFAAGAFYTVVASTMSATSFIASGESTTTGTSVVNVFSDAGAASNAAFGVIAAGAQ